MAKAILSRDVTIKFRGSYDVTAKAGTQLKLIKGVSGTAGDLWTIPAQFCDAGEMGKAGEWSIFSHDSKHFYIFAPVDAVQVIDADQGGGE